MQNPGADHVGEMLPQDLTRQYFADATLLPPVFAPNPSIDGHVGARLRLRRIMTGRSLESLASVCGISPATLRNYETGEVRITAQHLLACAEALHTRPSHFFEAFCGD